METDSKKNRRIETDVPQKLLPPLTYMGGGNFSITSNFGLINLDVFPQDFVP